MKFVRKPETVDAIQVQWANADALFDLLGIEEAIAAGSPETIIPTIVYVNRDGDEQPTITLVDGDAEDFDHTQTIGLLMPQGGDGNFLLVNKGDWILRHDDGRFSPVRENDFGHEWDVAVETPAARVPGPYDANPEG